MYSSDRIVVDEDSLYPKCYVCSQKYNVFDSINTDKLIWNWILELIKF